MSNEPEPQPQPHNNAEHERRGQYIQWATAFFTFLALSGLTGAVVSFISIRQQDDQLHEVRFMKARLDGTNYELQELKKEANSMRVLADKLASTAPANVQITSLSTQVASLQTQVKLINDAISQHPERVLSVPLLREDLDNLKESYRREQDNMQIELNRSYDLSKWLVLLMIPIVLALVSLVAGTFRQSHKTGV